MILIVSIIEFSLLSFVIYITLEYYSTNISTGYFGLFLLPFAIGVTIFIAGLVVGVYRSLKNSRANKIDYWFLGTLCLLSLISLSYGYDIAATWIDVLF